MDRKEETFTCEVDRIIWCPSMELYGVISKDEPNFAVKRCSTNSKAVFELDREVSQFTFMDDKALRTVVGTTDGDVDIINTDDGKVLYSIKHQNAVVAMEVIEHHGRRNKFQ